eukprot:1697284-Ditylum_brightwellii.AAC.1
MVGFNAGGVNTDIVSVAKMGRLISLIDKGRNCMDAPHIWRNITRNLDVKPIDHMMVSKKETASNETKRYGEEINSTMVCGEGALRGD